MNSAFGIDHGEVSKGLNPFRGAKAGKKVIAPKSYEDPFAIGDKRPSKPIKARGVGEPAYRRNMATGQSSLPASRNKERPLGRIKRSY